MNVDVLERLSAYGESITNFREYSRRNEHEDDRDNIGRPCKRVEILQKTKCPCCRLPESCWAASENTKEESRSRGDGLGKAQDFEDAQAHLTPPIKFKAQKLAAKLST